jgi:hypothetical protein
LHLEGGEIRAYRHQPESFTYIDSDITNAYNTPEHDEGGEGGKVSQVVRRLVYLRRLDRILIRDQIRATDPVFKAKWLLQSLVKPDIEHGMPLKGRPDNGIISTEQAEYRFSNERARLHVVSLLPRERETLVIGGRDYRFYTDIDGNAETLDGENMGHNSRITSWFEPALWRLEISDRRQVKEQGFLTLLSPSAEKYNLPRARVVGVGADGATAVQVDDEVIVFIESPDLNEIEIPGLDGAAFVRVFGLPANAPVSVEGRDLSATTDGTLDLDAPEQPMKLRWTPDGPLGNLQATR